MIIADNGIVIIARIADIHLVVVHDDIAGKSGLIKGSIHINDFVNRICYQLRVFNLPAIIGIIKIGVVLVQIELLIQKH